MKAKIYLCAALLFTFCLGFAVSQYKQKLVNTPAQGRVTGIGGIFFKCQDPKKIREWYQTHLGLHTNEYGAVFEWHQGADSTKKGFTQWSPFNAKTKYFEPSQKDFMINYRVVNLENLIAQLRADGVTICDSIERFDYGSFVHILDIEGNKIELWEPNDAVYEAMGKEMGAITTQ